MNLAALMTSPLAQSGRPANFLRLVLAEAGSYGMHGSVLVVLDDIAAMLGCYDPIPEPAAAHVSGPMVNWRSHPGQPTFERIEDVERMALKQRALIAFGGGIPGQMVGTAEIVIAMGNIIQGESPPEYFSVFQWASLDVLSTITGHSPEQILKDPGKKHWRAIDDDEVTRPGGRLYATYQTICTSIRRDSIAAMKANPEHPRAYLLPFARLFLAANVEARQPAEADDDRRMLLAIDDSTRTILTMFPELADTMDVPLVEQALASV